MAVVQVYQTPWTPPWPDHGSGELRVFANDTGNRAIDRVEIDNSQCGVATRVVVYDQTELWESALLWDQTYAANAPVDVIRTQAQGGPIPNNERWRDGTKGANPTASKYLVSITHEAPP
jgi:hypothetical protein